MWTLAVVRMYDHGTEVQMRTFRATYNDRSGKKRTARKWSVEFTDHRATTRRVTLFSDKSASGAAGHRIERLVSYRAASEMPTPEESRWLETLPKRILEYLIRIGLVDQKRAAAANTLGKHVDDFERSLIAKGNSKAHAKQVASRARTTFRECGFVFWSDLSADEIQEYLAEKRKPKNETNDDGNEITILGMSPQTSNFYLQAVKQFARWMVANGRAGGSPLTHLAGVNVSKDQRRERRALSREEFEHLLAITTGGPERYGLSGPDRALIYEFDADTAMRASEMRSLTQESFDLSCDQPRVTVKAAYTKNSEEAVIPLRPRMAELLRGHLADKLPMAPAFNMPHDNNRVPMLKADLAAAGIVYLDEQGRRMDFHALRHTGISQAGKDGLSPKALQKFARHKTFRLTMDRYFHLELEDLEGELRSSPGYSPRKSNSAAMATGTDGKSVNFGGDDTEDEIMRADEASPAGSEDRDVIVERADASENAPVCLADCLASDHGQHEIQVDEGGQPVLHDPDLRIDTKPVIGPRICDFRADRDERSLEAAPGFEPGDEGFANHPDDPTDTDTSTSSKSDANRLASSLADDRGQHETPVDSCGLHHDARSTTVDADDAPTFDTFPPALLAGRVAARDTRNPTRPSYLPDALDPRSLVVDGVSARPMAEPGQVVIFDAGRPGDVQDGEPIIVEVNGEMVLKRRATVSGIRIYESIAPGLPPVGAVPVASAGNEYPVVAVLHRSRRLDADTGGVPTNNKTISEGDR